MPRGGIDCRRRACGGTGPGTVQSRAGKSGGNPSDRAEGVASLRNAQAHEKGSASLAAARRAKHEPLLIDRQCSFAIYIKNEMLMKTVRRDGGLQ